ncbi:MAG: Ig-like domain-containing protein [Chloroflexi bacterium]|nr:Ig-like domain-containing protein [Chloroflexota bacterium]
MSRYDIGRSVTALLFLGLLTAACSTTPSPTPTAARTATQPTPSARPSPTVVAGQSASCPPASRNPLEGAQNEPYTLFQGPFVPQCIDRNGYQLRIETSSATVKPESSFSATAILTKDGQPVPGRQVVFLSQIAPRGMPQFLSATTDASGRATIQISNSNARSFEQGAVDAITDIPGAGDVTARVLVLTKE